MDYHAIHGHDVANFSTPGRPAARRVLTVSAADVDDALLSPASDEEAASVAEGENENENGAKQERPSSRAPSQAFVSTGLATLDGILAGVLPSAATELLDSDSDDEQARAGEEDLSSTEAARDTDTAAPSGSQLSRRRRRTPPPPRKAVPGGVRRGQLTEIWGPPGAGKTAFGMQLVANALRDGGRAVWIDCAHPLCAERLATMVDAQQQQQTTTTSTLTTTTGDGRQDAEASPTAAGDPVGPPVSSPPDAFVRYVCPSLPHWIAMLCTPPAPSTTRPPWLPPGTTLLVIDALSALVNYALPRTAEGKVPLMANGKKGPTSYEKRTQVLQYITATLERLAETCHLAVVVLTQCASRIGGGPGRNNAGLTPAINAVVWDRAIAARLVLFRDWAWVVEGDDDDEKTKKKTTGSNSSRRPPVGGRFVGVQKVGRAGLRYGGADNGFGNDNGNYVGSSSTGVEHVVGFGIREAGLVEVQYSTQPPRGAGDNKRKRGGATGRSDGEDDDSDYGWNDDDCMPRMPPQWQGSEDLLLGQVYGEEEEAEEAEEEDEADEEKEEETTKEASPDCEVDSSGRLDVLLSEWQPRQLTRRRGSQSVADSEEDSDV